MVIHLFHNRLDFFMKKRENIVHSAAKYISVKDDGLFARSDAPKRDATSHPGRQRTPDSMGMGHCLMGYIHTLAYTQ